MQFAESMLSSQEPWIPRAAWRAVVKNPYKERPMRPPETAAYPAAVQAAIRGAGLEVRSTASPGLLVSVCGCVAGEGNRISYGFVAARLEAGKRRGVLRLHSAPMQVTGHVIERFVGRTGRGPAEFFSDPELPGLIYLSAALSALGAEGRATEEVFVPFRDGLLCGHAALQQVGPVTVSQAEAEDIAVEDYSALGAGGLEVTYGKFTRARIVRAPILVADPRHPVPGFVSAVPSSQFNTWVPETKLSAGQRRHRDRISAALFRWGGHLKAAFEAAYLGPAGCPPLLRRADAEEEIERACQQMQASVERHRAERAFRLQLEGAA